MVKIKPTSESKADFYTIAKSLGTYILSFKEGGTERGVRGL